MKRDARRLSRNFQSKWVQCRYIYTYIYMYPALGFSIFHSRLGDSKSWKSSAIVSTLRAFNQASIFFLSLFLPFLLLVVVVDALPLRGFSSLSLSSVPAHQHGIRPLFFLHSSLYTGWVMWNAAYKLFFWRLLQVSMRLFLFGSIIINTIKLF